ncbi:hypothetical protein GCM10023148_00280 [Actinokineospora soli]
MVVANANYGARARSMEASYKKIQQISLHAERFLFLNGPDTARGNLAELHREWDNALELSENHHSVDYYWVLLQNPQHPGNEKVRKWRRNLAIGASAVFDCLPWIALTIPILLVVPFIGWFIDGV